MAQRIPTVVLGASHGAMSESPAGGTHDSLKAAQAPLVSSDLTAWIALRRVNEGGVTLLDESYYHYGRPVPEYLNAPFAELVEAGRLTVAKADPDTAGMQRIRFMQEGRDLYAVLCGKRGVCPDPPVHSCPDTADQKGAEEGLRSQPGDHTTSCGRTGGCPDR